MVKYVDACRPFFTLLAALHLSLAFRRPFALKPHYGDSRCEIASRMGDCDPQHCIESGLGQACEARFVRFVKADGTDYSRKTCRCVTEPVCTILPSNRQGCATYADLSTQAQRSISKWTMTEAERSFAAAQRRRFRNEYVVKGPLKVLAEVSLDQSNYSESRRHTELLHGQTRFCCHLRRPLSKKAAFASDDEPSSAFCFSHFAFTSLLTISILLL